MLGTTVSKGKEMDIRSNRPSRMLLTCLALSLGACATGQPVVSPSGPDQKAGTDSPNALQVTDISIPPGAKLDAENSLIIGTGDKWLGRVVIKSDMQPVQAYNHFYNAMPTLGWNLVTAVQAKTSNLTYLHADRVASIQIEPSSLGGVTIGITVSPRQTTGQESARPK
jgi:hypothetical protein